jgi:hypothetical protein
MSRQDQIPAPIRKLMETRGDNCTVCNREFKHCDITFAGRDAAGHYQLTGDCCAKKIKRLLGNGIYLHWSQIRNGTH